ncbi:hypothetical protein [Piscirickettsia litoralis]|uniref:ATP-grasp domain-containing protein n=1 Tax=Piscirickettsia litoralis TaxID=1891921 RepID=A0ABX3A341_9GAMM|nr:hypothetical protein [Piscirickettsia litoralis]ODN43294.1 hypothetical protein BGC07_10635 [Piscirickettsia litoralis]
MKLDQVFKVLEQEIELVGDSYNDKIHLVTADEINVELVGFLRDKYKINGASHSDLLKYRNKNIMKKALVESNIRVPLFLNFDYHKYKIQKEAYFNELISYCGLPFIIKPALGSASFDTYKIDSLESFKNISLADIFDIESYEYLVEEYIDGTIFCCDTISMNNKMIDAFVSEYSCPPLDIARKRSVGCAIPLDKQSKKSKK